MVQIRQSGRYWSVLIAWYAMAAALATCGGRFADSPRPVCGVLFGALELITVFAFMHEDAWGEDRVIYVRGTLANAAVAAGFTAVGVGLRAL